MAVLGIFVYSSSG